MVGKKELEQILQIYQEYIPNRIYSIHGTHPTIPSQESSGCYKINYL